MCSTNLIFIFAICVLLSAITCTQINPETYGEGICQNPGSDCTPQLPPPSTYQPYAAPPPPVPISPPPPPPPAPTPPPPAPTGYTPYGAAPPPPAGYPENCPPPAPEGESSSGQSDSPPSPPPSLYTYLNETSTSAASPPALPSVFNLRSDICTVVVYILFLSAALLYV